MRQYLSAFTLAVFAMAPIACKQSSEGGNPGTPSSFKFQRDGTQAIDPTLKPGETQTVEVKLNRGSDFNRGVKFDVKGTDQVTAEITPDAAKSNESPVLMVKVTAKPEAPNGEHNITLTGTPEGGGAATSETIKVTVKK